MSKNGSARIPEKDAYRIGEVAALTEIEPYVLRYWETEFPVLQPAKSPHGQRLYRRTDIETILTIKHLLYEQGFTIAGARKQLEATTEHGTQLAQPTSPAPAPRAPLSDSTVQQALQAVRAELTRLLTLLSQR